MAVIGFHFKKMSVEKKKAATGKINVNNNITMLEVKEAKVTHQAIILIGEVLKKKYQKSKLYDASFTHSFRKKER